MNLEIDLGKPLPRFPMTELALDEDTFFVCNRLQITMRPALILFAGLFIAGTFASAQRTASDPAPVPLRQAHAHNDYEHARPLLDALDHGFCGIEADIYLVGGKLLVAHDLEKVRPERTLEALYLQPLRARARQNNGLVYKNGPTIILLIDIKSDAEATYAVLRPLLQEYQDILTVFSHGQAAKKAVQVIISGNRPRATMEQETTRLAALDGRLPDLDLPASPGLIPLISDNWQNHFQWRGQGAFPEAERSKLRELAQKAHQQGRIIRFWAAPDRQEIWREMLHAGVDLINTDNLAGLQKFLLENNAGDDRKE